SCSACGCVGSFLVLSLPPVFRVFFFNAPPSPEFSTLSLHDALPIFGLGEIGGQRVELRLPEPAVPLDPARRVLHGPRHQAAAAEDRKSTRLNSSHQIISYAVFCLKKKKAPTGQPPTIVQPASTQSRG